MKKPKRKYERNPDPYESMVRAEKLDAYESLINFNLINKKNNKSIEQYEFIVDEKGMPWNYMYGIWHKYSQDLPNLYKVAGSLFINKLSEMKKTKYVINSNPYLFEIDSKFSIDIDNEWEFELAQILYKHLYQS